MSGRHKGLAAVEGFQLREKLGVGVDQVGQFPHHPRTGGRSQTAPSTIGETMARRGHRGIHVRSGRGCDVGDNAAVGRVIGGEAAAGLGGTPAAVDQ